MPTLVYHIKGLCIVSLLFFTTRCYSQQVTGSSCNEGILSGQVFFAANRPAASATILLLQSRDSLVARTQLADADGLFRFTSLPAGNYILRVSYSGQAELYTAEYPVDCDLKKNTQTGPLHLEPLKKIEDTAVITGKRPVIERLPDRMVLNTEQLISSKGSTAWDIMQKAPGVSVSTQGMVYVRGGQARVMINNKLQLLSQEQLAEWLKSVPSENIIRIEVITNPSASFGAEGGSLVNIILRRDNRYGLNGIARFSYQLNTFAKYRTGADLNYRKNRLNLYGGYSFSYGEYLASDINTQTFAQAGNPDIVFRQNQERFNKPLGNRVRIGADYYINSKNVIGVLAEQNFTGSRLNFNIQSDVSRSNTIIDSSFYTNHSQKGDTRYSTYNFNYKKTYGAKNAVMNIDLDYARFKDMSDATNTSFFYDEAGQEKRQPVIFTMQAAQDVRIFTAKVDFTQPLQQGTLEFGAKHSTIKTGNDLLFENWNHLIQAFQNDTSRSNIFAYTENVEAAYISFSLEKDKWKYQAGARSEYTHTTAYSGTLGSRVKRSYMRLFPTAYIMYAPKEGYSYNISIGNRINRPGYGFLNPFRFYSSPYSYIQGNPFLQPSFTYNAELGATLKTNYNITLYYKYIRGMFTQLTFQDSATKVTSYSRANLDKANNFGISLSATHNLFSWWQSNISADAWRDRQSSAYLGSSFDYRKFTYYFNINESFVLSKKNKINGELSFSYTSPFIDGLYWSERSRYRLDAGLRKPVLRGRATLALNATDLLRTKIDRQLVSYLNQRITGKQYYDERGARISFSYKFGKATIERNRNRTTGNAEEKNRL